MTACLLLRVRPSVVIPNALCLGIIQQRFCHPPLSMISPLVVLFGDQLRHRPAKRIIQILVIQLLVIRRSLWE